MYIIGITGGTGAGKSSAVKAVRALGAQALDCDEIYHELLSDNENMKNEIEEYFNNITVGGRIDRQRLSKIVWGDPASLQKLNTITHKYVNDEVEQRIASFKEQGVKTVAIDAIALIESGQSKKCNTIVGIIATLEERVLRITKRDKLTKENALMRINAQQPESFYRKNCNHILENNYDTQEDFEIKCKEFFRELLKENNHE